MNSTFSIRWQYGIRSLLMIGLAVYIISLSRTNALHYYLAPHMQKLLLLCPVPLLFIALAMAWHGIVGGGTVRMYVIVSTRCRKAGSKKHSYMECCSFRSYSVLCCPIRHLVVIWPPKRHVLHVSQPGHPTENRYTDHESIHLLPFINCIFCPHFAPSRGEMESGNAG